jgi:hypothetical protein
VSNELNHPSWQAAGWKIEPIRVVLRDGATTFNGVTHPDVPGLAFVPYESGGNEVASITHVATGLRAGLLETGEWAHCPVALRDALRAACSIIDYAGIVNAEAAMHVPPANYVGARNAVVPLYTHECPTCAWWHAANVPKRIAQLEKYVKELKVTVQHAEDAVNDAQDALEDAEHDLADAEQELRVLRAKAAMEKP